MSSLVRSITCHAFNADGSMCALSANDSVIYIFRTKLGAEDLKQWECAYRLVEHAGTVSALDWSHKTNLLVSAAHDRNAYVWKYDDKEDVWKPTLVILRINRAALDVKWSPDGNKFAVASAAKCVPICHFEKAQDWWVSKMIKKHRSTVLSVAWCPNNKFVVTGCCDNKVRVFSAFIKEVDNGEDDGFGAVWPDQFKFGEMLAEFDAKSWVHSVAWSPNGFRLAFSSHGATMHFVQIVAGAAPAVQSLPTNGLPHLVVQFVSDRALVAAGWDNNPALFVASGSDAEPTWEFKELLDKEEGVVQKKAAGAFGAAKAMWDAQAQKGMSVSEAKNATDTVLKTRHQNTITSVWTVRPGLVTTAGIDGRVLYWDLAKLGVDVKGLGIA